LEGAARPSASESHDDSDARATTPAPSCERDPNIIGSASQAEEDKAANDREVAGDQNVARIWTSSSGHQAQPAVTATQVPREQKELKLLSSHFSRNVDLWFAALSAIGSTAIFLMYLNGVISPRTVMTDLLKVNPEWTVFLIAVLGTITAALLNRFIFTSFEKLKWKLSLRADRGVSLLDFIALSRTTSWSTLTLLLISQRSNKPCHGTRLQIFQSYLETFRLFSLLRYIPLVVNC